MRVSPPSSRPSRPKGPQVTEVSTESFQFRREPNQLPPGHPMAGRVAPAAPSSPASAPKAPASGTSIGINVMFQPELKVQRTPYSETDPDYHNVHIPSGFQTYPFSHLSIRTLLGSHIAKFHRANKEASLRPIVEAISSTLEPEISAFDLMPGDFYFLMYWQRLNSMPKTPMLIEVVCDNEKHQDEIVEGVRDPETGEFQRDGDGNIIKKHIDTLTSTEYLTNTTLDVKDLEPFKLDEFRDLHAKYVLGYETMRDVVEQTEHIIEAEDGDPEFAFLASRAAFLARMPGRETLKQRMAIVDSMEPDELDVLQRYIEKFSDYGVSESANVRCKECGASTRLNISFDARTFLPGGR